MRFKDLSKIGDALLHEHVAKIIDIYIRWMIMLAVGDLSKSKCWFRLDHSGYQEAAGFYINHKTYAHVDGEEITNLIAKQMQSNKELDLDDVFTLSMSVFTNTTGRHTGRVGVVRGVNSIRAKLLKAHFGVKQDRVHGDSHRLIKALCLGKLESDIRTSQDVDEKKQMELQLRCLTRYRRSCADKQLAAAKALLVEWGLPDTKEAHSIDDLTEIAPKLSDYQIIVWSADMAVPVEVVRYNPDGKGFIGVFYHGGHFEFVTHRTGQKPSRFCYKCSTYAGRNHHLECSAICKRCGWTDCTQGNEKITCDKCNVIFTSQSCYEKHIEPTKDGAHTHCYKYFRCGTCFQYDRTPAYRKAPHICGATQFCQVCKQKVKGLYHKCAYAIPTKAQKEKKRKAQEKWSGCFQCRVNSRLLEAEDVDDEKENQVLKLSLCKICRTHLKTQARVKFFTHDLLCFKRERLAADFL